MHFHKISIFPILFFNNLKIQDTQVHETDSIKPQNENRVIHDA